MERDLYYPEYCAVSNTPCDGRCREKNSKNGQVYCSELITMKQALGEKKVSEMKRKGQL